MLRPSLEEVKALAKQYNTIPVFYEFSADNQTPLNIYRAFSQESRNSFILESVSRQRPSLRIASSSWVTRASSCRCSSSSSRAPAWIPNTT